MNGKVCTCWRLTAGEHGRGCDFYRPPYDPMPPAPSGFVACRVIGRASLTTHLVALDAAGANGGRPTMCGLTRFDTRIDGKPIPGSAGLPGWGMGDSGVTGPGVEQIKCARCYERAGTCSTDSERG
ncbi:hypothetical protein O1W71_16370 [Microbacterium sp. H37-C3]|uniref:hypothetical protein n=1 Tax=Microbacterium sp. H37-C3 TaxID=3004354 RepID=UPI0022B04772|nr:hypothetical protein [Microbacterium sp. H37-C3]MCZ4069246.1 hypothetical protein [Microbacterium sp. H37-C3]